jgi:predicted O-methyltransferase YrrM
MADEYQFTKDWFNWAPAVWEQLTPMLSGKAGQRNFLEIGSFEGRSSIWIAENMMQDGDYLRCIDTWEGGEEHGEEDMSEVEERFRANLIVATEKFPERLIFQSKGTSVARLAQLQGKTMFDFIYIDGSHKAPDVLTDACMAWPLLKLEGLMVFDDYMWGNPRDALHRPKIAIDAFTNIFGETAEIVHVGYQLVVRKKG